MDISKIVELGQTIEKRAGADAHREGAFALIARDALAAAKLAPGLDLAALVEHAVSVPHVGFQRTTGTDPRISLFASPDFIIEVRIWTQGDARVREQDWRGAYTLLSGSGVATYYHFEEDRRFSANLRTGSLVPLACDLVVPGSVRAVDVGPRSPIDHFFPLESPTAALVVRSRGVSEAAPPLTHFRPSVALAEAEAVEGRLAWEAAKSTRVAAKLGDEELFMRTITASIETLDRFRGLYVALFTPLPSSAWRDRFLDEIAPRFGDLEDEARRALAWNWSNEDYAALGHAIDDPDVRFALGARSGAPDSGAVCDLIRARYPHVDPFDLLVGRLGALIDDGKLSVAWDPDAPEEGLLRAFLRGESAREAVQHGPDDGAERRTAVSEAFELMAADPLLQSLRPVAAHFR